MIKAATQKPKNGVRRNGAVRPFVKWAGGKSQLVPDLVKYVPAKFNRYFEPFLGSGALFFHLLPKKAYLNDSNSDLINAYRVIKTRTNALIESLKQHKNRKDYFYRVRAQEQSSLKKIEQASRLIFLNKTCYNGLYRVNQKGQFNTPFGRYTNPTICDEENLKKVQRALKSVTISCSDYGDITKKARRGDFVYFDPPYIPVSKYSDFKRYTKESFYLKDHEELAKTFSKLNKRGCYVMLSNSYHPLIPKLYKQYKISYVKARRLINKNSAKRGAVKEVIVRNYS